MATQCSIVGRIDEAVRYSEACKLALSNRLRRLGAFSEIADARKEVGRNCNKACGEGLMPGGLAELTSLGMDPAGLPFHGNVTACAGTIGCPCGRSSSKCTGAAGAKRM